MKYIFNIYYIYLYIIVKNSTFYHSSYDDLDISSLKSLKKLTDL